MGLNRATIIATTIPAQRIHPKRRLARMPAPHPLQTSSVPARTSLRWISAPHDGQPKRNLQKNSRSDCFSIIYRTIRFPRIGARHGGKLRPRPVERPRCLLVLTRALWLAEKSKVLLTEPEINVNYDYQILCPRWGVGVGSVRQRSFCTDRCALISHSNFGANQQRGNHAS
jgi:hypothetical protein